MHLGPSSGATATITGKTTIGTRRKKDEDKTQLQQINTTERNRKKRPTQRRKPKEKHANKQNHRDTVVKIRHDSWGRGVIRL